MSKHNDEPDSTYRETQLRAMSRWRPLEDANCSGVRPSSLWDQAGLPRPDDHFWMPTAAKSTHLCSGLPCPRPALRGTVPLLHGRLRTPNVAESAPSSLCAAAGSAPCSARQGTVPRPDGPISDAQLQQSPPVFALGSHAGVVLDDVGTVSRPEGPGRPNRTPKMQRSQPRLFSLGCRVPHRARRGTVPCQSPEKATFRRPNASGVFPTVPCPRTTSPIQMSNASGVCPSLLWAATSAPCSKIEPCQVQIAPFGRQMQWWSQPVFALGCGVRAVLDEEPCRVQMAV